MYIQTIVDSYDLIAGYMYVYIYIYLLIYIYIPSICKSTHIPKFPMVPPKQCSRSHELAVIATILGFYALGYGAVTSAMPALTRPAFGHPLQSPTGKPFRIQNGNSACIVGKSWQITYKDYKIWAMFNTLNDRKSSCVNRRPFTEKNCQCVDDHFWEVPLMPEKCGTC